MSYTEVFGSATNLGADAIGVKGAREMSAASFSDDILTLDELATLLKAEPSQIYEMTRKRYKNRHGFSLPVFKVGRELRFRRSDVEKWIEHCIQNE